LKYSGIGGQAVIEGIMMKNGNKYAVGVRKTDGSIAIDVQSCTSYAEKYALARVPFIRGVFSFVESMSVGMSTLMYSASFFEDEEDEAPSKFELFLQKIFGDKLDKIIMTFSVVLAVILSLVLFVWFPMFLSGLVAKIITNDTIIALFEGILRVCVFISYIKLVSKTEDIKRTFMYHGAEHKCINCIEHGMPLSVRNVAASSKEHKRCGTSFIMIVMLISILFFVVIRVQNPLHKLLLRLVMIPVIAGVSYEILKLAGRSESCVINAVSKPGLWMQGLTTYEPDDSMIEVAIKAVEAVFDWRAFLSENFKDGPDELGDKLVVDREVPLPEIIEN